MTSTETFVIALVGVIVTGLPAIIAAVFAVRGARNTNTPAGAPSVGEASVNIAAAVTTPPDAPPLGQITADTAATVEHVHEAVCNGKSEP